MKIDWEHIYEGCIYKITNIVTNKVYIGSSICGFIHRKRCHITNLSKNQHHSKRLQNSWNKYGEENFKFEIIENCKKDDVLEREQYWIDHCDSYKKGYNATPIAGNCKGRPVSIATRLKTSNSLKGIKVIRTEEHNINNAKARWKPVVQYDKEGNTINRFDSVNIAAKYLSVTQPIISAVCSGVYNSKKFIVRYA